jgi:ArsR family metal-binding transcriptional regulator
LSPEEPVEPISTVERMLYPQAGYVNKQICIRVINMKRITTLIAALYDAGKLVVKQ